MPSGTQPTDLLDSHLLESCPPATTLRTVAGGWIIYGISRASLGPKQLPQTLCSGNRLFVVGRRCSRWRRQACCWSRVQCGRKVELPDYPKYQWIFTVPCVAPFRSMGILSQLCHTMVDKGIGPIVEGTSSEPQGSSVNRQMCPFTSH